MKQAPLFLASVAGGYSAVADTLQLAGVASAPHTTIGDAILNTGGNVLEQVISIVGGLLITWATTWLQRKIAERKANQAGK